MARKGIQTPALINRPKLPEYLTDALTCYRDLVTENDIRWSDFLHWADEYELQDREYVWEVINNAIQVVEKWQSSKVPSSSPVPPSLPAQK